MSKLNKTAKLSFYTARKQKGDVSVISYKTGYSEGHIYNMLSGNRKITDGVADEMYRISKKREKNSSIK